MIVVSMVCLEKRAIDKRGQQRVLLVVFLTFSRLLLLAQQNVKVPRALGAQRKQEWLQYCRSSRQTKQQGPHIVITEYEVQAYYLHPHRGEHTYSFMLQYVQYANKQIFSCVCVCVCVWEILSPGWSGCQWQ